ncbi:MAG: substrate-binding domain-containing protein [Rhizobiaceae bacterium]
MKSKIASTIILSASALTAEARPLEVVGTGDGMELVRAVGAAFTAEHPDRIVLVPPSIGSGGGIAAVGAGKALLARVARPLKPAEKETGLVSRSIFRLPTAIYVNAELKIGALSYSDLVAIYEGRITNWNVVGGPDLRIKVVRREDTDSSLTVLKKTMPGWATLDITSRSKTALTTQDAVETVKEVRGGIGFGPFSRVLENSVRVLSIGGLYPTDSLYPSFVTISYVWRKGSYPGSVRAFVEYGRSKKARALLAAHGAVPIELGER